MATGYPSAPSGRQPGQDRPKIDEDDLERLDTDHVEARARLSGLDSPEGLQAIARLLLDVTAPRRRRGGAA